MKKMLILTGSPRKDGNTALMVDAFTKGAKEAGYDVVRFDTAMMNIKGCLHCQTCWSKERSCSLDDDFVKIGSELEAADSLVFAAPMYWSQFPSHLKAVVDKLYAYVVPACQKSLAGKKFAMITCGDGADEHAFDAVVPWYEGLAKYMQWEAAGYVAVPALMEKGDVKKTDGLEKAYELGKKM
ncbi:MAG TPA: flavodoxin family protein [Candidatus Copromorpha excrementigallinarum]|uniref:Flavodoxin family protein n=1 Tax=Candidatus Allocopromorpha excrementigallinarum TaxID=2840742 RepID=A0A9D1I020_9FIRM|nr:flavodoxin family protein [Candidatus Copromorpha excrementigallinarum]